MALTWTSLHTYSITYVGMDIDEDYDYSNEVILADDEGNDDGIMGVKSERKRSSSEVDLEDDPVVDKKQVFITNELAESLYVLHYCV
jgi:hypothetical protein